MSYRLRLAGAAPVVLLAPASVPAQEAMTTLPCVPDCRGVDLSNTTLTGFHLNRVDLINADLSNATLTNVSLVGVDLTGASLFCANLIGTDLTAAALGRADMRKVDLSGKGSRPAPGPGSCRPGSAVHSCDDSRRLPGCYVN